MINEQFEFEAYCHDVTVERMGPNHIRVLIYDPPNVTTLDIISNSVIRVDVSEDE